MVFQGFNRVFKPKPLSVSFSLVGLLGFLITAIFYYYGRFSHTWGITFMVFFLILFIASLVSME